MSPPISVAAPLPPPTGHLPHFQPAAPPQPATSARSTTLPFVSIEVRKGVEAYIPKDTSTNQERFKYLRERLVYSMEIVCLHILDGCNWGAYTGIWAMVGATCIVSVMALPIVIKLSMVGGGLMFCEALVEAVLRCVANEEFERLPVLLDRIPVEDLPVIGDFLSFRWLKHLPFQGDDVPDNKLTFLGSRVVVGGVYGGLAGLFIALTSLSPVSILATGAVVGVVALIMKSVIYCARVIPDFVFLTNHEIREHCRYYQALYDIPIRERLVRNINAVIWNIEPEEKKCWVSPKSVKAASGILGIPCTQDGGIGTITKQEIYDAMVERYAEIINIGIDKELFDRFDGLFRDARATLERAIHKKHWREGRQRSEMEKTRERQRGEEQRDRTTLGVGQHQLNEELIGAGYAEAARLYDEQFSHINNKEMIEQARRRLLEKIR